MNLPLPITENNDLYLYRWVILSKLPEKKKMPELPEVETFRSLFNQHALQEKILKIQITDIGILRKPEQQPIFENKFHNQEFIKTIRHGKFLFIQASNKIWFSMHFGMSGFLRYENINDSPHKHDRALFYFENDHYLAFNCMRKFGKLEIIKNPTNFIQEHKFGPDSISISSKQFQDQISRRKRSIKSALLDQSIIAGVGNLYADEALFQARIHPNRLIPKLTSDETSLLLKKIQSILKQAFEGKLV